VVIRNICGVNLRERYLATLAGQLGHPRGVLGKGVARLLNRGNVRAVSAAVEAAGVRPGESAADIGFGGGVGLPMLLDRVGGTGTAYGIDISTSMIDRAARRLRGQVESGRLRLLEGSLTHLPLPEHSIDAAITVNTVYFVPQLDQAFGELARVLRPSGRLVVGLGDPDWMAKLPFTPYGFALRPVAELVAGLQQAGLTLSDHRELHRGEQAFHLLVAHR
jgi:SAM-dependent methyltransferase